MYQTLAYVEAFIILALVAALCLLFYAYRLQGKEHHRLEEVYAKLYALHYPEPVRFPRVIKEPPAEPAGPRQVAIPAEWWSVNPHSFTPRDPGLGETLTEKPDVPA